MLSLTEPAVTPAEAAPYIESAGYTGWPADETEQAQAIMRGQRYIATTYNGRWVTSWTVPPDGVRFAIIEAALREAENPGTLSRDWKPDERIKRLREKAGPVEQEVEYADGGASPALNVPIIEGLLRPYLAAPIASVFAV